jgi:hypothetical protein
MKRSEALPHSTAVFKERVPTSSVRGVVMTLPVMIPAIVMACLFAVSYVYGMGRPAPRGIPVAVVGPTSGPGAKAEIRAASEAGVAFRSYPTAQAAVSAISDQATFGALLIERAAATLLVSSASGPSVARALTEIAGQLDARAPGTVVVKDIHPLPAGDPQGLAIFYVVIATMVLGFVTTFLTQVNAPGLNIREWLLFIAGLAIVGGLCVTVVIDPLLGALKGSVVETWIALAAWIGISSLFARTMIALVRRLAIVPTMGTLLILGIPSSGGAVARPLLPAFYREIGSWLPNGAVVEVIRTITYFPQHQHVEPTLVLAAWIVGLLSLLLVATRLRVGAGRLGQTVAAAVVSSPTPATGRNAAIAAELFVAREGGRRRDE